MVLLVFKGIVWLYSVGKYINHKDKIRTMPVKKFALSVDENTYQAAKEVVESGAYRNMSHLFEEGAKKIIREEQAKKSQNLCEALASL